MRVLNKNILIKHIRQSKKDNSIFDASMLSEQEDRYHSAKVYEVGCDVVNVKNEDTIYYDKHKGYSVTLDNERYLVINEIDIIVVI